MFFPELTGAGGDDALRNFNMCFYQAMAMAAQHPDAYVMIPGGAEPEANSVWKLVEFPSLTWNPSVKRIIRVDPRPPKERGKPDDCEPDKGTVIWDASKDKAPKAKDLPFLCRWVK